LFHEPIFKVNDLRKGELLPVYQIIAKTVSSQKDGGSGVTPHPDLLKRYQKLAFGF